MKIDEVSHLFAKDGSLIRYINSRCLTVETLSRGSPLSVGNENPLDKK
jgi:hypothetical protein